MILDISFQYSAVRFTDWEVSTMAVPALKCWAIFRLRFADWNLSISIEGSTKGIIS